MVFDSKRTVRCCGEPSCVSLVDDSPEVGNDDKVRRMGHGVVDGFVVINCHFFHDGLGTVDVLWEPVRGSCSGKKSASSEKCKNMVDKCGGFSGIGPAW